jgi:hypothetical protein
MAIPKNPAPHWAARQRFYDQKGRAGFRNIKWELTFDEWYKWWLDHGIDKDIPTQHNKNQKCMCRFKDEGPYSLSNIYCGTRSENTRERNKTRPNNSMLGRKGDLHPRFGKPAWNSGVKIKCV